MCLHLSVGGVRWEVQCKLNIKRVTMDMNIVYDHFWLSCFSPVFLVTFPFVFGNFSPTLL